MTPNQQLVERALETVGFKPLPAVAPEDKKLEAPSRFEAPNGRVFLVTASGTVKEDVAGVMAS